MRCYIMVIHIELISIHGYKTDRFSSQPSADRSGVFMRRVSYVFLCLVPFLAIPVIAIHALRVSGIYQTIGGILFVAILGAAWHVARHPISSGSESRQRQAIAGALLLVPYTDMSLLWVGLATPWDSTPLENRMRYLVLLVSSIAITGGFVVLREALQEAGERLYSTLGSAANLLAGTAYLIWLCFMLGAFVVRVNAGQTPAAVSAMNDVNDVLLFVASALTYIATVAFAAAMARAGWLGRGARYAYVIASSAALLFLMLRGMSYPDPTASATPWYARPGFIAGVPAIPWVMPFLLGAVVLRRA
jgi:hypothetical protein